MPESSGWALPAGRTAAPPPEGEGSWGQTGQAPQLPSHLLPTRGAWSSRPQDPVPLGVTGCAHRLLTASVGHTPAPHTCSGTGVPPGAWVFVILAPPQAQYRSWDLRLGIFLTFGSVFVSANLCLTFFLCKLRIHYDQNRHLLLRWFQVPGVWICASHWGQTPTGRSFGHTRRPPGSAKANYGAWGSDERF